jgi:Arylsulfotransferase (ASST)
MRRLLVAGFALGLSVATLGLAPAVAHATPPPPTQSLAVAGTDVGMYPAFDPSIQRYGITTDDATAGTVTVTATTTDPAGSVWVDGQPAATSTASSTGVVASTTVNGLASGDEISVFIDDSAGTAVYSLIYLPAGFPTLTATSSQGIAPGDVFMTLTNFSGTSTSYETAVDNNGVPVYVRADPAPDVPLDFKRQPNGDYSVYRTPSPTHGRSGGEVVELDSEFREIAAYQTDGGLVNTDGHDSILLPNGDRWLLATQPNPTTADLDAIIQEQAPDGTVLFQWSTADHVDRSLDTMVPPTDHDYAHINSISLMQNGDILASFRHLDQVMEIATSAHDGFSKGDVVWRLGGRRSTFTFPNDPDDGPCAQHAASQLPNGDILLFDDGSESINGSPLLCLNQDDTTGPAIARPQTRISEYSLDTANDTATLVWSYQIDGQATNFAGSAQRLSNGDTMIGWAASNQSSVASEVDQDKNTVWNLTDNGGLFTYRAFRFLAPDTIPPDVDVSQPASGARYVFGQHVNSGFSCTDRGGSSLQSCNGSTVEGAAINTSVPGAHTFTVVAEDGAGNTTTVTRTYHVGLPPAHYQPDALVKAAGNAGFVGGNIYGGAARQHVDATISRVGKSATVYLRLQNDGNRADRFAVKGTAGGRLFTIAYLSGARTITKPVTAGTFTTPSLEPGQVFSLRLTVTRTARAKPRHHLTVTVTATSQHVTSRHDSVAATVRALR